MLTQAALWGAFIALVVGLLAIDLMVFHRHARPERRRDALFWSAVWIGLALLFNLGVYLVGGPQLGLQWTTGYLLEKSLSIDNVFLFLLIFSTFAVPETDQHRVLFWGVLGAMVMRGALIIAGGLLLSSFHPVLYLFGGFLIVTGLRLLRGESEAPSLERNGLVRLLRRFLPVTSGYEGERFLVRRHGTWSATPLLLVLLLIESTDLLFALDSIPAIYGVTTDPFLVFSSNVFAILGLRALFLVLRSFMTGLIYLRPALAAILVFVGAKLLLQEVYALPALASLVVIVLVLGIAISASLWRRPVQKPERRAVVQPD
jgi:tellurite resistance protein TerC